mmetsp:Transcript_39775/g.43058  ORF Transcript_39775/g.43058 Transcript_39775/m.43058 type:complete len:248 (-) Transcript_39775:111-854(-)
MSAAAATRKTKIFFASTSKKIHYWLEHHPVVSNSAICLNLWVVGDVLAQYAEHKNVVIKSENTNSTEIDYSSSSSLSHSFWKDQLDWVRTVQCASYGAFVTGPILAIWYPYLDRVCLKYKLALRYGVWAAPIAKVAADEFLMDPPTLVLFFGYMNACEGGTLESFQSKLQTQFFPSWFTSLAIWPVVLLGTFRFFPVPFQAPVINVCCIVWDAFLSHRNSLAKHDENANKMKDTGNDKEINEQETQL